MSGNGCLTTTVIAIVVIVILRLTGIISSINPNWITAVATVVIMVEISFGPSGDIYGLLEDIKDRLSDK